ncbi:MAG: hypothetical protein JSV65_07795 [Armatimonadota bacterium]|nr:MAG: hypothetical protein JSV65_07795 [Armatimonadota bacterium]
MPKLFAAARIVALLMLSLAAMAGCGTRSIGSLSSAERWKPVRVSDPGPGKHPEVYTDIDFVDAQDGWAAVLAPALPIPEPRLIRTSDGGQTWADQGVSGVSLDFVSERLGWAVERTSAGAKVGRTLDGGTSWNWHDVRGHGLLWLAAISANEVWAIGEREGSYTLLRTQDGGQSWEAVRHPLSEEPNVLLLGLAFRDPKHGWVLAERRRTSPGTRRLFVLLTRNAGETFEVCATPGVPDVEWGSLPARIAFPTEREGWIACGSSALLRTTDGGKTWAAITPLVSSNRVSLVDCSFPDRFTGWAVGAEWDRLPDKRAVAVVTGDGGKTWRRVSTGAEEIEDGHLTRVVFVDTEHGWIAGEGGIVPSDFPVQQRPHMISFILKYIP